MLESLAETTWRRLRGESRADSWPFGFEVARGVMRRHFKDSRELEPRELRERQENLARRPNLPVERVDDEVDGVDCEWFLAESGLDTEEAALVYLHGGGYIYGSTRTHAELLGRLAVRTRLPVLGVNYRLCPEHDVRDAREDVLKVHRELLEDGWSAENIVWAGDSAGGALAITSAIALREAADPLPAALALISPWADLHCDSPSYDENDDLDYGTGDMMRRVAEVVLDGQPADDPVLSPVYADLSGLPPTLMHAGGGELVVDDCRRLAEAMEARGVQADLHIWEEMVHAFHIFASVLPTAEQAIGELAAFLRSHVAALQESA